MYCLIFSICLLMLSRVLSNSMRARTWVASGGGLRVATTAAAAVCWAVIFCVGAVEVSARRFHGPYGVTEHIDSSSMFSSFTFTGFSLRSPMATSNAAVAKDLLIFCGGPGATVGVL